jgi:peptidoglycan lytic transglycosylase B
MFDSRTIRVKFIIFLTCFLMLNFFGLTKNGVGSGKDGRYFDSLQDRLIKDGFDKDRILALYKRPEVNFEIKGVTRFLVHREATLNYDQFSSKESIHNALQYMADHKKALERTEKNYGVDKETITAILLVETRLGAMVGGPLVLNTLSTTAALADAHVRDMFWDRVSKSIRLTRKQFDGWVRRKSEWAYKELKAFLEYTTEEHMDAADIPGSFSGAMGLAQFMPSNILVFAKDGDNNGITDLFDHADAISSIGNYLKHYGWHPGIDREKAYHVIYHYNHSPQYVNTILKVSAILKSKT